MLEFRCTLVSIPDGTAKEADMRLPLASFALFLLVLPAGAQSGISAKMCQAKPTPVCALELAVEVTRDADAAGQDNLPWDRLVETAARGGHVDIAMQLADKLDGASGLGFSSLVVSLALAGRLPEIGALLTKWDKKPGQFSYLISPALVEAQRDAELAEYAKTVEPADSRLAVELWRVIGDLRANRSTAALERIARLPEAERPEVVSLAAEELYGGGHFEQARAIMPLLSQDRYILVCQMATALRDRAYADACESAVKTATGDNDADFIRSLAATALAATDQWKKAIEFADMFDGAKRGTIYANIAIYSREPEVLRLIDRKMKEDPADFVPDVINRLLVKALVFCGYETVAEELLADQPAGPEQDQIATSFAAALAQNGNPQAALGVVLAIDNPARKAWALWEVASNIKD
jgi:hypothetical protein